ncbi:MAG: D-alanine--D-alanine ligase [Candidatus Omnitrophica bacterium]|nr:D-alanine--D-alanine ligase [Candidatus Omnitrophota bacterium]
MKNSKFGKVGILSGGPSNEREISLKSGRAVYEALIGEGCDAILLDVKNDICDIITSSAVDMAFIALHGRFGEDGTVQRILEDMGVPYTGSGVEASRLALDKIATKDVFHRCGIPVPGYTVFEKGNSSAKSCHPTGWPVVVKPQFEGSSIGLSIAGDESSLKIAVDKALGYGDKVLIEEYINGRELTVGILGEKALPVIEIITSQGVYDYEAKYKDPATRYLVPAPIDEKLAKLAGLLGEKSHMSLGCRSFSRVDMMLDKAGRIFVLEVNTIPGMTERSLLPKAAKAAGIDFGSLCIKLLEDGTRIFKSKVRSYHGSKEK